MPRFLHVAALAPVPDLIGSDDAVDVHADLDAHVARAWERPRVRGVLGAQEDDAGPEAVLSQQLQSPLHQRRLRGRCLQLVQSHALRRGLCMGPRLPESCPGPRGGAGLSRASSSIRHPTGQAGPPRKSFPVVGRSPPSHGPACPPAAPHLRRRRASCSRPRASPEKLEGLPPGAPLQALTAPFLCPELAGASGG